jgi:hypothetical protein
MLKVYAQQVHTQSADKRTANIGAQGFRDWFLRCQEEKTRIRQERTCNGIVVLSLTAFLMNIRRTSCRE